MVGRWIKAKNQLWYEGGIRDEEWNIYRRYSDFYALHNDLRKTESLIDSFNFPPKKSVGYKAEKVVEERRKRLQSYLRQVKARFYTSMVWKVTEIDLDVFRL